MNELEARVSDTKPISDLPVLDARAPISVGEPFRRVNAALLELLEGLPADAWARPTVHPNRSVKDLVAHLLHGSLRRVTGCRDRYVAERQHFDDVQALTDFIQSDNQRFMQGMFRISPQILIELLRFYDPIVLELFAELDPMAPGVGVAWAGEWSSPNWFDVAREYTEKWHHQQQLRDATEQAPLYAGELLSPVLETFARGFPHALRGVAVPVGAALSIETVGAIALGWTLERQAEGWLLRGGLAEDCALRLRVPAEVAWRPWTKSMTPEQALGHIQVEIPSGSDASSPQAEAVSNALASFVAIMA